MDTPTEYPKPRRRGPLSAALAATDPPPPPSVALETGEDARRFDRVRFAAEMLVSGHLEHVVVEDLCKEFGISPAQARRDLRDVRAYAQQFLGDEDAISAFVLQKLGQLQRVSDRLLEDTLEEAPELVYDAETGGVTSPSLDQRIKGKQQVAASARAFSDVTKVQFSVIGARSRHYSPRAREGADASSVNPDQQKAMDAFWSSE